jgi:hypothetical protein
MASFEETRIALLQKEIDDINTLISSAVKTGAKINYKRDDYSVVEAAQLVKNLTDELDLLVSKRERFLKTQQDRARQISLLESNFATATKTVTWAQNAFTKGDIDESVLQTYLDRANSLRQQLNALTTTPTSRRMAGATEIGAAQQRGVTGELTEEELAAYQRRSEAMGTQLIPPVTSPETTPSGVTPTGTPPKVTKKQVSAELAARNLEDTPANRAAVRKELTEAKTVSPAYRADWENEVRRLYSQYAWMLDDLDRNKYEDVFDLLAEAVNPETRITDPQLFKTRFEATSWYQELATQQMGRRVRSAVGALSFNPANYAKLLNNAMRFGWEGDNLKAEAYKEVFRKNDDGTFANPNAVGEARKSNDYLAIKTIGSAFLSPMSDDRIVETLTGTTTRDDLLRIYREKAKVSNPHLAQAIDAGVTLEDIAYDYRKAASDVLGVPLAGIPLTEDFLGAALKAGEPGKPRLMTTNEWKTQLKSNPDYGYQFTGTARKEVNDIVSSLEKAFGFVR